MRGRRIAQGGGAVKKNRGGQRRVAIAMHYGSPPIMTALREDVCDGFVIGGGANRVRADATVAATADKPFFLELVGTGIPATFSLHFSSVLANPRWPHAVFPPLCHYPMIKPTVRGG